MQIPFPDIQTKGVLAQAKTLEFTKLTRDAEIASLGMAACVALIVHFLNRDDNKKNLNLFRILGYLGSKGRSPGHDWKQREKELEKMALVIKATICCVPGCFKC